MTKPSTNPGCFGSALTAQETSEVCQRCPVKSGCFVAALEAEPQVMAHLTRKLTVRGELEKLPVIEKYLALRKSASAPKSDNARSNKLLERFRKDCIDLAAIKDHRNPFDSQSDALFFQMAQFVIQGLPFKPKDLAEYVQANCECGLKTASLKSEVARFSSALVAAGVLERRETYVLCLIP